MPPRRLRDCVGQAQNPKFCGRRDTRAPNILSPVTHSRFVVHGTHTIRPHNVQWGLDRFNTVCQNTTVDSCRTNTGLDKRGLWVGGGVVVGWMGGHRLCVCVMPLRACGAIRSCFTRLTCCPFARAYGRSWCPMPVTQQCGRHHSFALVVADVIGQHQPLAALTLCPLVKVLAAPYFLAFCLHADTECFFI